MTTAQSPSAMPESAAACMSAAQPTTGRSARRARDAARRSSRRRRICAPRCASASASTSARRRAQAAIRAEIAYYRAHLHEGRDAASLADLRRRCAEAMEPVLGFARDGVLDALLGALRFLAYPDAAPALRALRAGGIRLVVVSNWDCVAARAPAGDRARAAASTARSRRPRSARPSPTARSSRARSSSPGRPPAQALARRRHARGRRRGRAAPPGSAPVLIARDGAARAPAGVPVISSLAELPALCRLP